MAMAPSSRRVLLVSFLVNVFDVVSNLVVALLTGSAVVFAEMAKGLADTTGSALLVITCQGMVRSSVMMDVSVMLHLQNSG